MAALLLDTTTAVQATVYLLKFVQVFLYTQNDKLFQHTNLLKLSQLL